MDGLVVIFVNVGQPVPMARHEPQQFHATAQVIARQPWDSSGNRLAQLGYN